MTWRDSQTRVMDLSCHGRSNLVEAPSLLAAQPERVETGTLYQMCVWPSCLFPTNRGLPIYISSQPILSLGLPASPRARETDRIYPAHAEMEQGKARSRASVRASIRASVRQHAGWRMIRSEEHMPDLNPIEISMETRPAGRMREFFGDELCNLHLCCTTSRRATADLVEFGLASRWMVVSASALAAMGSLDSVDLVQQWSVEWSI